MSETLDVLNSSLASTLRLWRGTRATDAARQPARLLQVYEFEACPYCRLVREALTELDIDALILPSPHGGKRFRPRVARLGGKQQFPYLVDPNTGRAMYESDAIIAYLYAEYGKRRAPALLRPFDVATATLASLPRLTAGAVARASKPARRPLELFSFESSPYSRRVRELLCELELRYVLRNAGKALWQDLGPPSLRAALFPNLPVAGRNRRVLLARAGRVQLPYLIDPNTGVEMFESTAIRDYLAATYGAPGPDERRQGRPAAVKRASR
ncbi:MAG TPA: glutathione S-transferase N-terminal domain-containing protein [Steroidobacteraceae bacterium]|nr:glutathione S-transferase N-terminal domain-containing protein [Steroidobacteraceae bacterium]